MSRRMILNENGGVFLMVMFCGLLISVLGVTAYYVANTELTESSRKYEKAKALYLAEGGLERAILELQGGIKNGWDDEIAGLDKEMGTDDDGILSFGAKVDCYSHEDYLRSENTSIWNSYLGHYDVRIVDGRRPGESPGKCNRVVIGSDGISTKDFRRRVEAEVELWELKLPQALVYIDGRGINTKYDGSVFLLDGKDTNPDLSSGSGPDVPAILVPSWQDAITIRDDVESFQCDKVLGIGNMYGDDPCTPSVTDLASWNSNDFNPNRFRSKDLPKLESLVNNVISGGTYAGQIMIGSPDEYLITKCEGYLHCSGLLMGYGILIVEGNLIITGEGEWHGLIITKNHAWMSGGGSGIHLFGTLLVMNESGIDNGWEFRYSGTSDGYYCTKTITKIQDSVMTLVVNRWRQSAGI